MPLICRTLVHAAPPAGRAALLAALAAMIAGAAPACAAPWQSRTSNEGSVDAIGIATPGDGSAPDAFKGLSLLSVACTDDDGKPLKSPSVSFMAYFPAGKRPGSVAANLSVDGKPFKLAGRAYKDTPYYYEVRSSPAAFLKAAATASAMTATVSPGDFASTFDMAAAKDVLGAELAKCRR